MSKINQIVIDHTVFPSSGPPSPTPPLSGDFLPNFPNGQASAVLFETNTAYGIAPYKDYIGKCDISLLQGRYWFESVINEWHTMLSSMTATYPWHKTFLEHHPFKYLQVDFVGPDHLQATREIVNESLMHNSWALFYIDGVNSLRTGDYAPTSYGVNFGINVNAINVPTYLGKTYATHYFEKAETRLSMTWDEVRDLRPLIAGYYLSESRAQTYPTQNISGTLITAKDWDVDGVNEVDESDGGLLYRRAVNDIQAVVDLVNDRPIMGDGSKDGFDVNSNAFPGERAVTQNWWQNWDIRIRFDSMPQIGVVKASDYVSTDEGYYVTGNGSWYQYWQHHSARLTFLEPDQTANLGRAVLIDDFDISNRAATFAISDDYRYMRLGKCLSLLAPNVLFAPKVNAQIPAPYLDESVFKLGLPVGSWFMGTFSDENTLDDFALRSVDYSVPSAPGAGVFWQTFSFGLAVVNAHDPVVGSWPQATDKIPLPDPGSSRVWRHLDAGTPYINPDTALEMQKQVTGFNTGNDVVISSGFQFGELNLARMDSAVLENVEGPNLTDVGYPRIAYFAIRPPEFLYTVDVEPGWEGDSFKAILVTDICVFAPNPGVQMALYATRCQELHAVNPDIRFMFHINVWEHTVINAASQEQQDTIENFFVNPDRGGGTVFDGVARDTSGVPRTKTGADADIDGKYITNIALGYVNPYANDAGFAANNADMSAPRIDEHVVDFKSRMLWHDDIIKNTDLFNEMSGVIEDVVRTSPWGALNADWNNNGSQPETGADRTQIRLGHVRNRNNLVGDDFLGGGSYPDVYGSGKSVSWWLDGGIFYPNSSNWIVHNIDVVAFWTGTPFPVYSEYIGIGNGLWRENGSGNKNSETGLYGDGTNGTLNSRGADSLCEVVNHVRDSYAPTVTTHPLLENEFNVLVQMFGTTLDMARWNMCLAMFMGCQTMLGMSTDIDEEKHVTSWMMDEMVGESYRELSNSDVVTKRHWMGGATTNGYPDHSTSNGGLVWHRTFENAHVVLVPGKLHDNEYLTSVFTDIPLPDPGIGKRWQRIQGGALNTVHGGQDDVWNNGQQEVTPSRQNATIDLGTSSANINENAIILKRVDDV